MILSLDIEGSNEGSILTLVRDIQHHPVTGDVLHIDLQRISIDEKLHIGVPIELAGMAKGVKDEGGVLDHGIREVTLNVKPMEIPEKVSIDISHLEIGQFDSCLRSHRALSRSRDRRRSECDDRACFRAEEARGPHSGSRRSRRGRRSRGSGRRRGKESAEGAEEAEEGKGKEKGKEQGQGKGQGQGREKREERKIALSMSEVAIVCGLGNPGPRYRSNRHNLGFMALDTLSERHSLSWRRAAGPAEIALWRVAGRAVTLIKPLACMNESGAALAKHGRRGEGRSPRRVRRLEPSPRRAQAPPARRERGAQGARFPHRASRHRGFPETPARHRRPPCRTSIGWNSFCPTSSRRSARR